MAKEIKKMNVKKMKKHDDIKEDKKLIKMEVKKSCMKKK